MSVTKIPNVSNLFREAKHLNSCVRIHACVTQFLKIRAISSTWVFKSVVLCILAHALSSAKEMADSSEIR